MLSDTNLIVDALRGNKEAIRFFEEHTSSLSVSVITLTELYAGMRGKEEVLKAQKFLDTFEVYPVNEEIAQRAGEYLNYWAKTHHFGIADALIAATAAYHGEQLATRNVKDFPMLDVLQPY